MIPTLSLAKEELYRRLDTLVPGDSSPENVHLILNTELYCERLTINGLHEMHRYSIDERFYEYFEFKPFTSVEQTKAYIEKLQGRIGKNQMDRTAMYWFVRRKSDGYLIGTMNLIFLNYERQSVEWGFGVDPELWGHGYVLQIQEMLKHYVFEVLRLNRLQGTTMGDNKSTIASVIAAGMKSEGTFRDFYCKNGVFIDAWQYAMLREEYFASKRTLTFTSSKYTIQDVIEIVQSVLTEEKIVPESTIRTVMSWDSLNHMSIMIAVSERTGIALSPSEMVRANSVQALVDILAEKFVTK